MSIDISSILFLQQFANPVFDLIAVFFALFFTSWASAIFFFFVYMARRHKKFFHIIIGIIDANITVLIMKWLVQRARPGLDLLPAASTFGGGFSYPSGHAATAFVIAVLSGYYFPKTKKWMYLLAILAALSRVYLGIHYPTDVIAGAIVGIIIAIFAINLDKPLDVVEQKINKSISSFFKR